MIMMSVCRGSATARPKSAVFLISHFGMLIGTLSACAILRFHNLRAGLIIFDYSGLANY